MCWERAAATAWETRLSSWLMVLKEGASAAAGAADVGLSIALDHGHAIDNPRASERLFGNGVADCAAHATARRPATVRGEICPRTWAGRLRMLPLSPRPG